MSHANRNSWSTIQVASDFTAGERQPRSQGPFSNSRKYLLSRSGERTLGTRLDERVPGLQT